jgi:hypothetical protein
MNKGGIDEKNIFLSFSTEKKKEDLSELLTFLCLKELNGGKRRFGPADDAEIMACFSRVYTSTNFLLEQVQE